MSKTLQDHHNEGQQDRADGNGVDPPHGTLENVLTWSSDQMDKNIADNAAYWQGYKNNS